jgi:hypothetical protein
MMMKRDIDALLRPKPPQTRTVAGNAPGQTEFQSKKGQKRGFFLKIWTQTDVKKT